jgi:hypothetical protein
MNTFDDLFQACGGAARVGRMIGVTTEHATSMKRRGSIPASYWPDLIRKCASAGIKGVTYEVLAAMAAARRRAVISQSGASGQSEAA